MHLKHIFPFVLQSLLKRQSNACCKNIHKTVSMNPSLSSKLSHVRLSHAVTRHDEKLSFPKEAGSISIEANDGDTEAYFHNQFAEVDDELVPGPEKKVALLLAYCGENYHGIMMNRGDRQYATVEKELLTALIKARLVKKECWYEPYSAKFITASRTDKGVSAIGQIISVILKLNDDTISLINNLLPPDIRVIGIQKTVKRFSAWRYADFRDYSYTLPTYAFADSSDVSENYRITQDKMNYIRSIAYRYKGNHNFHNFTSSIAMDVPQAVRTIMNVQCEKPFIEQSVEFVRIRIRGRSFVLNQIRKMIGLMIAVVSGRASEDFFIRTFSESNVEVPMAPGSGLLLERISYTGYDNCYGDKHGKIDFSRLQNEMDNFYEVKIRPFVLRKEIEERCMMEWLEELNDYDFTYDDNCYSYSYQMFDGLPICNVMQVEHDADDICYYKVLDNA